jgi:drug/metabolite transporter (DMT)-like permease
MNFIFAPILIVLGLVIYQVSQKSADQTANPFVVIILAYVFGIVACVAGFFVFPRQDELGLLPMLKSVSWTAFGIGLGAAIIEIGFLLAYRAGWNVGILPLSVTAVSTIILLLIGLFVFRESLSTQKIIGILLCFAGLALITLRK